MPDEHEPQDQGRRPDPTFRGAIIGLMHPIPLTVLMILISVFFLMGKSVFSEGSDVLTRMADHEFARGLITYLFAVTTIGTAVVLVLAAMTGALAKDEHYTRGKDILALLLGVFGTIVGFYFGSEAHASDAPTSVTLSQPLLVDSVASPGDTVRITAFVTGGAPPYEWGVSLADAGSIDYSSTADASGWIVANVPLPPGVTTAQVKVRLGVRDSDGKVQTREATVRIRPRQP